MGVTHTNILAESKIFLRKVFNRPDVHNFFGYILGVRFHHFQPCNSLVINGLGAEKVINMPFFPKKSYPHGIVHKFWVNYLDISGIFRIFMVVPYIKKMANGRTVQGKYTKFGRHNC